MKRIAFASIILVVLTIACAPTSTPVPPTAPVTAIPAATATPTLTPAPTRIPTNTPTPTPAITAATWASDANGKVNPQTMYPFVGAIDYKHRKTIDLMMGQLRLAVVTDQDLTKLDANAQKDSRMKLVSSLGQNEEFQKVLEDLRKRLISLRLSELNITIVVEGGKPIQVISQQGDGLLRYKVDLVEWKGFNLLPDLRVNGAFIERADNVEGDRRIQIANGVGINTFGSGTQNSKDALNYISQTAKLGGNAVRFLIDIGKVKLDELQKAVDFAEANGMYVIVAPDGNDNPVGISGPTEQNQKFITDWAQRFVGRSNIIFEPINEVDNRTDENWFDDLVKTSARITQISPNALMLLPGREWNRDFSIYKKRSFPLPNVIYDVHHYNSNAKIDNSSTYFDFAWIIGNRPVIFTEAGANSPSGARNSPFDVVLIKRMRDITRKNPWTTHWLAFEMSPGNWAASIIDISGNLSSRGHAYFDSDPNDFPPTRFER